MLAAPDAAAAAALADEPALAPWRARGAVEIGVFADGVLRLDDGATLGPGDADGALVLAWDALAARAGCPIVAGSTDEDGDDDLLDDDLTRATLAARVGDGSVWLPTGAFRVVDALVAIASGHLALVTTDAGCGDAGDLASVRVGGPRCDHAALRVYAALRGAEVDGADLGPARASSYVRWGAATAGARAAWRAEAGALADAAPPVVEADVDALIAALERGGWDPDALHGCAPALLAVVHHAGPAARRALAVGALQAGSQASRVHDPLDVWGDVGRILEALRRFTAADAAYARSEARAGSSEARSLARARCAAARGRRDDVAWHMNRASSARDPWVLQEVP